MIPGALSGSRAQTLWSEATITFYPLKFHPILKSKVWGGRKMAKLLGKSLPEGSSIGESWEIADRPEGTSVVADGLLAGKSLRQLLLKWPDDILGTAGKSPSRFPLLVKFLDAAQDLSLQVHPDDAYARLRGERDAGKTEAWYVISAQPGARIIRGLKQGTSRDIFRQLLAAGQVKKCLNRFVVHGGETVFLPAGTVHALGKGILVAEIQQNSDLTYRVYDWDRAGLDGRPRPLHLSRALDVIDFRAVPRGAEKPLPLSGYDYQRVRLVACEKFVLDRFAATGKIVEETSPSGFLMMCIIRGSSIIRYGPSQKEEVPISAGDCFLLPAKLGRFSIDRRQGLEGLFVVPQHG